MEEALKELAEKICDMPDPVALSDEEWKKVAASTTVALMAGGKSSRFMHVIGDKDTNKSAFVLPNGKSMIEMTVEMYRDAGINDFVALTKHSPGSIKARLGDGSKLGINLKYFQEIGDAGTGGVLHQALKDGAISPKRYLIIVNPTDLILDCPVNYPRHLASAHIMGERRGNLGTVGVYPKRTFPGTALSVQDNQITAVKYEQDIPVPIHLGVAMFSPEIVSDFSKHFDRKEFVSYEASLFPFLVSKNKLGTANFPGGIWFPIKDEKTYGWLLDYLEKSE